MDNQLDSEITQLNWLDEDIRKYIQSIYRVQHFYSNLTDIEQLITVITEECKNACNSEAGSLLLYDDKKKELSFQVTLGPVGSEIVKKEIRLPINCGIAGEVARTKKPIIVNDVKNDPHFFAGVDSATQFSTRNILAVPMIDRQRLIGVIEMVNKIESDSFSHEDLRFLEILASWAASAVVTSQLIQEKLQAERFATIGYTITALAHHLKNILTGMLTSTELIEKALNQKNYPVVHKSWPILKRTSLYIFEFVQDLLMFSKPRVPQKKYCNLKDIIEEASEFFSDLFSSREIKLKVDISKVKGKVFLDPNGILHCLTNLILNAGEVVPEKTGIIKITGELSKNNELIITVSDNGKGIPTEQLNNLFEPFFTTKGYKGTGLGLSVTKKIIEEHGGKILVTSKVNSGTQFKFIIPQTTIEIKGKE
ncbi:MAG TPA: ATP-binding protein [Candidatus Hydrogenedens sp.]|nr:ATP-binding protein [Candidatus Hydrogenedens sp.]